MDYTRLGETGMWVSELCLGAMTFGSQFYNIGTVDQSQANRMVNRALEVGVNFFDTANVYSFGESEQLLGEAFDRSGVSRDDVVLATKVGSPMSEEAREGRFHRDNINRGGLSRKHIRSACERSLARLGTDYIDLYQVHRWDPATSIRETLEALTELVREGKVRYIGCSNWASRHVMKALYESEMHGLAKFVSVQAYYSLVGRDLEYEQLPLCREEGLGVLPWSPLAGGFLTGKYRRGGNSEEGRRVEFDFPPVDKEMGYDVVEALDEIASEQDASIPQVALAWLRDREGVSSVIIGARTMEQLEDNLGAAEVELNPEDRERLSELSQPDDLYPQWMIEFTSRSLPSER